MWSFGQQLDELGLEVTPLLAKHPAQREGIVRPRVEPAEPSRLNGLIATGMTPSCSSSACAVASCRAPVTSRWAVRLAGS